MDDDDLTAVERAWLGEYLRGMNPPPMTPGLPDLATWEMNRRFKLAAEAEPRKLNRAERRAGRKGRSRGNGADTR